MSMDEKNRGKMLLPFLFLFLLLLRPHQFSAAKVAHVAAEGVTLQVSPTERLILRRPRAKARLWTIAKFFSEQECEFVTSTCGVFQSLATLDETRITQTCQNSMTANSRGF